jgi:hypothetical protein
MAGFAVTTEELWIGIIEAINSDGIVDIIAANAT